MSQKKQPHDWFADAAESLVRYRFVREGFFIRPSRRGSDCVIEDMRDGKKFMIEIRSTDRGDRIHTQLIKLLKRKRNKSEKPDIYVEVRLESKLIKNNLPISLNLWKIDKDNNCLIKHSKLSDFRNGSIRKWTKEYFKV